MSTGRGGALAKDCSPPPPPSPPPLPPSSASSLLIFCMSLKWRVADWGLRHDMGQLGGRGAGCTCVIQLEYDDDTSSCSVGNGDLVQPSALVI